MNNIIFFGEYTFETSPMVVMRGLEIINLPSKQLETLAVLLMANGEVVDKETFLTHVWGEVVVEEHNLTQTIFLLRKALGKLPNGQEYIETVPKRGYRISLAALHPDHSGLAESGEALELVDDAELEMEGGRHFEAPASVSQGKNWNLHAKFQTGSLSIGVLSTLVFGVIALLSVNDHAHLVKARQLTRDGLNKDAGAPLIVRGEEVLFTELQHFESVLADVSVHGGTVDRHPLPFKTAQVPGTTRSMTRCWLRHVRMDCPQKRLRRFHSRVVTIS